ncbi:MAG: DUF1178 family protein [Burkholderiaceae bacterium]|nr:MAG: DUF1178 family protein [Burkholderiaceae bacterium]|tara:strand:+ start:356 stop:817 length:462 start_codon:yes stop_codon:yes gene_type:complete
MKVYNLKCQYGHSFEGWFRSNDEFLVQSDKGILSCPVCDDNVVTRLPSAAHIQAQKTSTSSGLKGSSDTAKNSVLQSEVNRKLLEVAKHILENAENVGSRFAKEARKIHRKEAEERSIYGTVTTEESKELRDEGIDIFSIPVGVVKKKPKSIQ